MSDDVLITVQRLPDGRYRAERDGEWVEWSPVRLAATAGSMGEASTQFRADLRALELGVACADCGYLEFEHYIDGEERAPCSEFK